MWNFFEYFDGKSLKWPKLINKRISCSKGSVVKIKKHRRKSTNKYMYEMIATHEATMRITRRKKQVNFSAICVYCSENISIQNIIAISLFEMKKTTETHVTEKSEKFSDVTIYKSKEIHFSLVQKKQRSATGGGWDRHFHRYVTFIGHGSQNIHGTRNQWCRRKNDAMIAEYGSTQTTNT